MRCGAQVCSGKSGGCLLSGGRFWDADAFDCNVSIRSCVAIVTLQVRCHHSQVHGPQLAVTLPIHLQRYGLHRDQQVKLSLTTAL